MLSLLIHAALGALAIWIFFRANDCLCAKDWPGSWTIIDGPRRGLRWTWIYFVMSLFTSFGFAMGMYLAAQERQVRWNEVRG